MRFFHELGVCVLAIVLFCCSRICNGQFVSLVVNASAKIAETDENFICATLDWWPPEKCDYGRCSWVGASLLNLDLENPVFAKALKAFSPLKIRLGGTLQDKLIYDVGPLSQPCHPFARDASKMFGFSKGCLTMDRWDKLNKFAAKTGSMVAFGLNALYGRYQISADGLWGGPWNSSNARSFIQYTVDHGYKIYAWEFGNELSGSGIGARVSATQYAADVIELHKILKDIYKHSHEKPLTVAPDGFFDPNWFQALLQETGSNVLNAVTRHIYNLGAGVDKHLTQKILNPQYLSREATKFRQMRDILQKYGPWASSWVGEAGGAYNSGKHRVSDAFVNSFWYLDQLGMSSTFNTKVYCRQSLIGGNYGLLNTTTFAPNPDYYSALLWHRLMGKGVLSVNIIGPPYVRTYAHCAKNDDLENPVFAKAIKAFSPLKIRLGGTLQDKLIYDVGPLSQPCHPFVRDASKVFNFSKGCLTMDRWDKLNKFFTKTGSMVAFGLNAMYGRYQMSEDGLWGGPWNSSNARNFIQYTVDHGYKIYAWEFGNELSGDGIGAKVSATQYAADVTELSKILKDIYKHSPEKPLTVAPDGFFDATWFQELLQQTGPNVLNVVTRHIYNLGAGVDKHLMQKILNPGYLSREATKFKQMQGILQKYGPWASSWVGEAGGAYNGGKHRVSDAFVNSFWYLDQLGMSSTYDTKVYCRQSLIGGNYGLLNTTNFAPNPDYYSALLWHRLMGRGVLSINITGPPYVRTYAHCAKNDTGITLLLINLSNDTKVDILVSAYPNSTMYKRRPNAQESFIHKIKRFVAWAGIKTSKVKDYRMEYHLTPKDGDLHSQTVLLNGADLELTEDGDIPSLDPVMVDSGLPIPVAPLSIAFVSLPGLEISACLQ